MPRHRAASLLLPQPDLRDSLTRGGVLIIDGDNLTCRMSPTLQTFSTRSRIVVQLLIWHSPTRPGSISMKAPNSFTW